MKQTVAGKIKPFGLLAAGVLTITGLMLSPVTNVAQADSSMQQQITVKVLSGVKVSVKKVNDKEPAKGSITYSKHNTMRLTSDKDAKVSIKYGNNVLWQGELKKGQATDIAFNLPGGPGKYELTIFAEDLKDSRNHGSTQIVIDYRAILPPLIPGGNTDNQGNKDNDKSNVNAPNTGAYVMIGNYAFSTSTIAVLVILIALAVFVYASRDKILRRQLATAKAVAKADRKERRKNSK